MKHPDRVRRINTAADLTARLAIAIACGELQHLVDAMNGWPAARSYEQDRYMVTVTATSTPTRDPAADDLKRIDRAIRLLEREAGRATDILARYQPRPATAHQQRETAPRNSDTGCKSCARLPSPASPKQSRWEPSIGTQPTTVGGILIARPMYLCRWCYDWVRGTGRIPTPDELARHHAGKKVKRPA